MDSGSAILETSGGGLPGLRPRLERFGRYFLLDRIATGGMAEVYRAVTHGVEGFRRTFVVKRILTEKAGSPTFIRMFCEEARISALLLHPNIVQVYDFGHVNGSYFLAMEYLPGKDLSSLMRVLRAAKAAVPAGLAAYVAREAAVGLHHAHTLRGSTGQSLGIVHRDVTPSNIMLLFAGGVKLLDFGIAKATTGASAVGEAEGVKGKFGYLSPEQARGGDIDGRSDVFSLGVTLWEMLVGRRLFAGKNELETLRNVLQKPVAPPSSIRPEVPAELDRIVLRALERNRDRRYRTAEELARDCELVVRDARADGQALRVFLNDLFAEESSSLSLDVPELPDELFADGPQVPVPSISAVPRDDQSLEIEVIEPSAPQGRARNPAPPFGVIAADASSPGLGTRRLARPALWAGAALAALLVCLGLVRQTRHPPRTAVVAAPVPAPIPVAAPAPPAPVAVEPSPAAAAEPSVARPEDRVDVTEERRAHGRHRPTRAKELSTDLTLNPF
jgi:serine/threonine protein kinase